jgi:hypothetical protein
MRCRRCHGSMTVDAYIDMGSSGSPLWLRAWRCGNCGNVYEPEVFLSRVVHRNWLYRAVRRLVGKRLRRGELMALTV